MEYKFIISYSDIGKGFMINYDGNTNTHISNNECYESKTYKNFYKCVNDLIDTCRETLHDKEIYTKEIHYHKNGKLIKKVVMRGDGEVMIL